MCSSSPVRTPKLQLTTKQPLTGECWKGKERSAQFCLTLCDPHGQRSLPDSSIHGIFQARILEWVAISFPSKKDIWHPRTKEKPQQDSRRGKIVFRIEPIPSRDTQRTQRKPCVHHEPHKRLSQTCLWVLVCLLRRHGSAVACCGDRGSGCSRPGSHAMWYKSSWRRSPLVPPQSH